MQQSNAATLQLSLWTGRIQFSGPDNNSAKHMDRLHFGMSYYGNSTIRVHELESSACVNTNRVAVNSCSNYHLTVRMFRVGLGQIAACSGLNSKLGRHCQERQTVSNPHIKSPSRLSRRKIEPD